MALLVPMLAVMSGLLDGGPKWEHVQDTVLAKYIGNTLILVCSVTTLAMLFAVPAAWLVSVYDFPCRRTFSWLLILPLSIPTYVAAFVYYQIPEAAIPLLIKIRSTWGMDVFLQAESVLRYGTVSVLMASVLYPYIYLTARVSFSQQCRHCIEAARTLGKGSRTVFWSVALPIARPALVAGGTLVVMEAVNDYGAVHLFGIPTLTEGIFRTWFGLEDAASALRLAGLLIAGVMLILFLENLQRGRAKFSDTGDIPDHATRIQLNGFSKIGAMGVCSLPIALGLLFPLWQLLIWAWRTWGQVFQSEFFGHLVNSFSLALGTAFLLTALALLLGFAMSLHKTFWLNTTTRVAALGYATPGAVIAIGVMATFGTVDGVLSALDNDSLTPLFLSGTFFAIIFAYCVRFMSVSLNPVQSGMTRICSAYAEASFSLGHSKSKTLNHIVMPMLRGTLGVAFVLVFIDILKELPLTMILRPANFETMATIAFSLASEGRIHECAVPSIVLVASCAVALGLVHRTVVVDD